MVQTLYSNGANSIWEHSLLDPASVLSGRRKAGPQDRLHVRTGNLETCLRLLSLGAQANFFHPGVCIRWRTWELCLPRLRWTLQHSSQINTPLLTEAQRGSTAGNSTG
ncbi:hypothetical protein CRUP_034538 [Coryphaenoides rupestris]|nr:hypothetical protein CRUP_034538 [Coryphaenoides rupestris]